MAKQGIDTGGLSGIGADTLYEGALKINSNFDEIYNTFGDGTTLNPSLGSGVVGSAGTWAVNAAGIHTTKNVGIGTELSTSALTVEGDARFSGVITATSVVKSGGTSSEFLKADGSVDNNTYLTTESQTLDSVLALGNTSSLGMSIGVVTATRFESLSAGTPTLDSPNNLNINAITVAISTDLTVGRDLDVVGNTTLTNLNASGIITSSSFVGSLTGNSDTSTYATTAGIATSATNINITGTNLTDSVTYIPIVQNLTTGSQSVYLDAFLAFNATDNTLIATNAGNQTGTVDNNLTKTGTLVSKDGTNTDTYFTSALKQTSSGIGSTTLSLVGTSGTLPSSFEMIVTIHPTNLNFGSANDMQISKLIGVYDGQSNVSVSGYAITFTNASSEIATFTFDQNGDNNSLRMIINPTGSGTTTEYTYKVQLTYTFSY